MHVKMAHGGEEVTLHKCFASTLNEDELSAAQLGWCNSLNRRLGGLHKLSGPFGEDKKSYPCWESNHDASVVQASVPSNRLSSRFHRMYFSPVQFR